ncbi:MAG: glycosyltransferase family 39 protein [Planctomycetota bacterium]
MSQSTAATDGLAKPYAAWMRPWPATLALVVVVSLVRTAIVALTPYTLIEDEAHYWEWAQRLDWSYYSKGPGIAWLIWAGCASLGDTTFGVRMPAVLASAVGALAVAWLARDMTRTKDSDSPDSRADGRAGFIAAAVFLVLPPFQIVSLLATIDGPYLAAWALAIAGAWRALHHRSAAGALLLGTAFAVGFLFKYTVLLLVPGLLLYAVLHRRSLNAVRTPWWLASTAIALLGLLPVAIWNAQHDWVTVRHLLGHLGAPGGDVPEAQTPSEWSPIDAALRLAEFAGLQLALVGPALVLMFASASKRARAMPRSSAAFALLIAAPMLVFYAGVSLFARTEGNWTMAAYVSLAAACGPGVVHAMDQLLRARLEWLALPLADRPKAGILKRAPENIRQIMWHWALGYGIAAGAGFALMPAVAALPVIGDVVPIGRLTSADVRAQHAVEIIDELRARTQREPVLIAQHYGRSSQMAFEFARLGRSDIEVYCASAHLDGRRTQYDVWPETDLSLASTNDKLRGRPTLLLGGFESQWLPITTDLVPIGELRGEHKRGRDAFTAQSLLGFDLLPTTNAETQP